MKSLVSGFLSQRARSVPESGIREIAHLAAVRDGCLRLEIGEPDFKTPDHIVEAAFEHARGGVGYTATAGIMPLREAIAAKISRVNGLDYSAEDIVVSQGAVQGIAACFMAVLEPGSQILLPDPAWPNYEMAAVLLGAEVVRYPLRAEAGFRPDPSEIETLITDRTRLIVVNSPGNPTGAVLPSGDASSVVEMAARNSVLVLSDEVYDEMYFDEPPVAAAQFDREFVIGAYSFSKTYAMTGWRVGYVAVPEGISKTLGILQEPFISSVSEVSQAAALAALQGPQDCVAVMRDAYKQRRDLLVSMFSDAGLDVSVPGGAFYMMWPLPPGVDAREAAFELLELGVSVAPGTAFGRVAFDQVRVSLASSKQCLTDAATKFLAWRVLANSR